MMKVVTVLGARPQFVKAAMVSKAIAAHNTEKPQPEQIAEILLHTGQHYNYEMSDVFFETLELPAPLYHLGVGSGAHGRQTAEMLNGCEQVLLKEEPDMVVLYGDTNSTLAGALAAAKLQLPVAHVEAGLRSFNRRMPEEINRLVADHLSTLLFAPTSTAVRNLEREGITCGVSLTGDVMFQAAMQHLEIARQQSKILQQLQLGPGAYALATVHRADNTDSRERLLNIIEALIQIGKERPVIWPVHPRTRKALDEISFSLPIQNRVRLLPPVPYQDMLVLEASAQMVLTDSGGVQKEARWFNVPCITLREETEWLETLEGGWNRLAGAEITRILEAVQQITNAPPTVSDDRNVSSTAAETIVSQLFAYSQRKGGRGCESSF
jgi:UDP-N-acetylglucosamine 2-epimerase (non-hydrolysing)/UDP-GlcNAc3NAcA epimerase